MSKQKDVLRKFIEAKLPGLRKPSLTTEVEILEDFVNRRKDNPKSIMYSRNFLNKTKNAGYHLERLRDAGAVNSSIVNPVRVVVDFAEKDDSKKTKRGYKQIRHVRELRASKMIEHANKDVLILKTISIALSCKSIGEVESKITYSTTFQEEKIRMDNYNIAVGVIKKKGFELKEYDFLFWRNTAKPWKLTDDFVYHLIDKGINLEG